jgi:hypothetical protein
MKEVDFIHAVRLEAWNPAEKARDLASKFSALDYRLACLRNNYITVP